MAGQQRPKGEGPLAGLRIIEMAGIGPVPLAGLMLAELGATVLLVERVPAPPSLLPLDADLDLSRHGRLAVRLDLKQPRGRELLLRLCERADILMEGFRPGVMERLGLGPDAVAERNPGLIYGRMTGFGQEGPLSGQAGHDLTYLAYSGVLHAIGPKDGRPVPPLNLVADYGGGTMFLIMGLLSALFERSRSGRGQVVDAAMIDGASMLAVMHYALLAAGISQDRRGVNLLDGGTPFYDTYETADGRHMSVACLEPQFFAEFCRLLPLHARFSSAQYDRRLWPDMREAIAARFAERTRDEWAALFEGSDACVAPVLSLNEAPGHPHNVARAAHVTAGRLGRPAPAPRFSRTPGQVRGPAGNDPAAALAAFGIEAEEIEALAEAGIVGH